MSSLRDRLVELQLDRPELTEIYGKMDYIVEEAETVAGLLGVACHMRKNNYPGESWKSNIKEALGSMYLIRKALYHSEGHKDLFDLLDRLEKSEFITHEYSQAMRVLGELTNDIAYRLIGYVDEYEEKIAGLLSLSDSTGLAGEIQYLQMKMVMFSMWFELSNEGTICEVEEGK